jgi:hypothetical protein
MAVAANDERVIEAARGIRPVNPVTKTDWEGVGVVPDVQVAADAALDEAVRRATKDIAMMRQGRPKGH